MRCWLDRFQGFYFLLPGIENNVFVDVCPPLIPLTPVPGMFYTLHVTVTFVTLFNSLTLYEEQSVGVNN